ncbi:MAG: ABC transporter ATP-binding protein [Bacillota bacterium]|nr:ABC transporter ATP-binding protein [Bacillota bacterium]
MSRVGMGGMGLGGGAMHAVWRQRRTLRYLEAGGRPTKETARRLLGVLRPHAGQLALALALTSLGVILGLVPPLLMREIIDRAVPQHDVRQLLLLAAGLLLFPAAAALVSMGQSYINAVVGQGVIHDLRTRMYEHGQQLGIDFFTRTPGGEIHARLVNDLNAVQGVLNQILGGLFVNALTVLLTLATMFGLDVRLALASTLLLPTFALPVLRFGRRSYDAVTETQEALARVTAHLEETLTLSGIIVVKSFGAKRREARRFRELSEGVRRAAVRQSMVGQGLGVAVQILSALGPAVVYGYGGYLVMSGKVQLGTVVAFATYLVRLYQPASSLAGMNTTLLGGLALFDRVFQFLDLPVDVPEPSRPREVPFRPGSTPAGLAFRDVRFAYPAASGRAKGEEVLHGISFEARPGELTAIVGPSGAGKSTILSLAARFYDPDAGEVCLAGVPLREVADGTLRRAVSVVTQELFLFHASLRENIRYGRPEASEEELEEAVEAAQLAELVARLPRGLETVVGERGYRLSGGEKQRVAIARAILRNPSILLLDEATSSLDSHAERLLQEALTRLFRGRTVIAIAHRLSTILAADQILVVQAGRIVERGRHEELLARGGLYARLYHEQFDPLARRRSRQNVRPGGAAAGGE